MRERLLLFLNGCMELCWIFAWVTFLTSSAFHKPSPITQVMIPFFLAAIITFLSKGRGWRVLTVITVHIGGLLLGVLQGIHYFKFRIYPFFDLKWIKHLFESNGGFVEWISIVFILICVVAIYVMGVKLVVRKKGHINLCSRFDLGIAAFFALFLIRFMFESKGEFVVSDPGPQSMILPFFIFSLLAIPLARNRSIAERKFLTGYHLAGTVIGFSLVVLALAAGSLLLFLPFLTNAAEAGFVVLKAVSEPFGPIIVGILRFIFQPRNLRTDKNSAAGQTQTSEAPHESETQGWAELIIKFITWGIAVLLSLLVLSALAVLLWYLIRWLLSKTPVGKKIRPHSDPLLVWLYNKFNLLLKFMRSLLVSFRPYENAQQIYMFLQRWGKMSGLYRMPQETPEEYGNRLKTAIPGLEKELTEIVNAFNEEIYGKRRLDKARIARLKKAASRLRSPVFWLARTKMVLLHLK